MWGCCIEVGQQVQERRELINSAQNFQGWTISFAFLICSCLVPQPSTHNILEDSNGFKVEFNRKHRPHCYRTPRSTELLPHRVFSAEVRLSIKSHAYCKGRTHSPPGKGGLISCMIGLRALPRNSRRMCLPVDTSFNIWLSITP